MSTIASEDKLLTTRELAERLHRHPTTLSRLITAGLIPEPIRFGRRCMWKKTTIDAWIELGCPPRAEFEARQEARKTPTKRR